MRAKNRPDARTAALESLRQRINRLAFHAALGPRDLQHAVLGFAGYDRPPIPLVASIIEAVEWHRDAEDRTPAEEAIDGGRPVEGFALHETLALARGLHAVLDEAGPPRLVAVTPPRPGGSGRMVPPAADDPGAEPTVRVAHVGSGACVDFASGQVVATSFPSLAWSLLPLYPEAPETAPEGR